MKFGPKLAKFFEGGRITPQEIVLFRRAFTPQQVAVIVAVSKKGLFTPEEAKAYREGIPESCP